MKDREISILDHGFVRLVDHLGDDSSICQAARVSYGKGTKTVRDDRALIRYLIRHRHDSPLEFVDFRFHLKVPIFVARHLVRHRTFSMNEVSARYSELPDEYYTPDISNISSQSTQNKQGRSEPLSPEDASDSRIQMHNAATRSFSVYKSLLEKGVARELARACLPVSAYTEFYWKANLRNIFHFLKLRLDSHAQYETRQVAAAVSNLVFPVVPLATEAFEDYVLNAHTFSNTEMQMLRKVFEFDNPFEYLTKNLINGDEGNKLSAREKRELVAALRPPKEG